MDNDVKSNIKKIRENKKISTYKLAELLTNNGFKISQSAISKIENGNKKIDSDMIPFLATVLGVSIQQLYFGDNKPKLRDIKNVLSTPGFENVSPFDLLENGKEQKKQLNETVDKANNYLKDFFDDIDEELFLALEKYIENTFDRELNMDELKELYLKVTELLNFELYKLERTDKNGK